MEMKRLAIHVAELPTWITMTLNTDELDFAKSEYKQAPVQTSEELVAYFEKCLAEGKAALEIAREEMARALSLDMAQRFTSIFKALGFKYVTLDLEGYRQGSLNEVLNLKNPGT